MVARLQQAVEVIKSVTSEGNDEEERREVILHAFSNGGGTIASHLAMQLQDHRKGRKLFDRVIFECMPVSRHLLTTHAHALMLTCKFSSSPGPASTKA